MDGGEGDLSPGIMGSPSVNEKKLCHYSDEEVTSAVPCLVSSVVSWEEHHRMKKTLPSLVLEEVMAAA